MASLQTARMSHRTGATGMASSSSSPPPPPPSRSSPPPLRPRRSCSPAPPLSMSTSPSSSPCSSICSGGQQDTKAILILSPPTVVGKCKITEEFERLLGLDQASRANQSSSLTLSPSFNVPPRPLLGCYQCQECPGFIVHSRRNSCFICNCPRSVHNFGTSLHGLGRSKPLSESSNLSRLISRLEQRAQVPMVHEGYAWSPPGLSASKTEEWMRLLPDSKVPKLNTSGEKHREMQLQYQIPQQDISLKHCHHVDKKDHDSFENFTRARNDIALDIAHAIDSIKENSVCLKCQKVIVAGSVAVMAPKFGFNTHWHPACFTCATCDEILVDLTYCVFNDKIFCERHYAENLKPRCGSCDELIFSGEYTKALNKDWHCDHFFCWLCQTVLTGKTYVLTEDNQCCIPCYEKNFTHSCQLCQNKIGIEEKDMGYKDMHWHEDCFTCQKCKGSLSGKPFAVKNTYIFCGSCYDSEFASRCEACAEPFKPGTKRMDYKNRKWHETCFQCVVCKVTVGTKPFIIPDETDVYCVNCFEDKFATKCTKCKKVMTTGGVTFKNESWHRECFTCANCDVVLAGQKFASKNEQPYCAKCYGELFAKRCTACSEPITGTGGTRFISFEGRHWHSQCFKCAMCNLSMAGKGFITDGEDIICPDCAKNKLTGV